MSFSPLLNQLIDALRCLPGVGPKSAQRMAFHLLERGRDRALHLSDSLQQAISHIGRCNTCRTFSETTICSLCNRTDRDRSTLCVVENPIDVLAIEQTSCFKGLYFVLMGHLSPLDGIGPDDIGIADLQVRVESGEVSEVIIATNPTVEGEATAHYIAVLVKKRGIKTSRIAHGVPLGSELEFVDGGTLSRALLARETL